MARKKKVKHYLTTQNGICGNLRVVKDAAVTETSEQPTKQIIQGKTIAGSNITMEVINHDTKTCCEFVVSSPKFSFPKWIFLTAFFNLIAFMLNFHTQDQYLMCGILVVLLFILFLKINFKVQKESLLVMSSLGVQLTTTFASGRTASHFICLSKITDIIINEAVTMQSVIFYLCLLLQNTEAEGKSTLIPLFKHTWPNLLTLQYIHKQSRQLLIRAS